MSKLPTISAPMFGPTFEDYYRNCLETAKQEILRESDEQILGSDVDQLGEYYLQKFSLQPIAYNPADITYDIEKNVRRVLSHERDEMYRGEGDIDWEYKVATISIPIVTNPNSDWIKKLGGPTYTLDGFDSQVSYSQNKTSYAFNIKGYGFEWGEEQIANEINSKSDRLLGHLHQKNTQIELQNVRFLTDVKRVITDRQESIKNDKEKLSGLTSKIRIPIKQKSTGSIKPIIVNPKAFIQIVKPTPVLPEEYVLERSILLNILDFVDSQCESMERTPSAFKLIGEEHLRDIILSALNGIFQGDATGETFIKKGKSDIHLKIKKGEILIFECKKWGGEKLYLETIDQLMGYVTWKQNYGVLIMFCQNKNFSSIIQQAPDVIKKHSHYANGYSAINLHHFVSKHSFPEDAGKIIEIHHLIYNLYS